jgi:hypothetical protein
MTKGQIEKNRSNSDVAARISCLNDVTIQNVCHLRSVILDSKKIQNYKLSSDIDLKKKTQRKDKNTRNVNILEKIFYKILNLSKTDM